MLGIKKLILCAVRNTCVISLPVLHQWILKYVASWDSKLTPYTTPYAFNSEHHHSVSNKLDATVKSGVGMAALSLFLRKPIYIAVR